MNEHPDDTRPIACTLTPAAFTVQRDALLPGLLRRAAARHEIANGYAYTFAPADDLLHAIAGTLDRERRCCQFLRFQLIIEPALGPIRVEISGPTGTRDILASLESAGAPMTARAAGSVPSTTDRNGQPIAPGEPAAPAAPVEPVEPAEPV